MRRTRLFYCSFLLGMFAAPFAGAQSCNLKAPESPVNLTAISYRFPIMEFYSDAIKSCGDVKNVRVNTSLMPFEGYVTQVSTALAGGGKSPYDIVHLSSRLAGDWGGKGQLLPLDDLIKKYKSRYNLDDIPEALWDVGTVGGKTYGIPVGFNTQIIFYRKDIFDSLGLKPPKTFAEYQSVLEALAKAKKTKYPSALSLGGNNLVTEFNNNLAALGGKWFDANNKPVFNSPQGVKAAEALRDWVKYMPPSVLNYSNDDVMVALQQGDIAISKVWQTRAGAMDDKTVSRVVGKIMYAPAYSASNDSKLVAATAGGDMYGIPANTKTDPDTVFRILMEAVSRGNEGKAAQFGMVSRTSISNNAVLASKNRSWAAASANARNASPDFPKVPYINLTINAVASRLNAAISKGTSVKDALDDAADQVAKDMKAQGYIK